MSFVLKIFLLLAFMLCDVAYAQKSDVVTSRGYGLLPQEEIETLKKERQERAKKDLAESIEGSIAFGRPRFVKRAYKYLQSVQKAVDAKHKELSDSIKDDKKREEELEKAKRATVFGFEEFDAEPKAIVSEIAQNPKQAMYQIMGRIKTLDADELTEEETDDLAVRAKALFEKENGMTYEEFSALSREQMLADMEQLVPAEQLGSNVRFELADDVVVEKIDETTGIVRKK